MTDYRKNWPDWLRELETAERDEHGLTEAQRENTEGEIVSIAFDWQPKARLIAARCGISEELAVLYLTLINSHQRYQLARANESFSRRFLERAESALAAQEEELRSLRPPWERDDEDTP